MKNLFRVSVFLVLGFVGTIFAEDFRSKVVTPGNPIQIRVSGDGLLLIRNFTQDGGTDRGFVTVTKGTDTANVLTAAILSSDPTLGTEEVINSIVVSGPADVTVTCGTAATSCFISYKKVDN